MLLVKIEIDLEFEVVEIENSDISTVYYAELEFELNG